MAEEQREPVPRNDSGELDTSLAFLAFARHCVLKKADGLSDEQLRRVLVDSGTSILGLVQHLTVGERYWFGYHLDETAAGAGLGLRHGRARRPRRRRRAPRLPGRHRRERRRDPRVGDPGAVVGRSVDGERKTLRWLLAHMTSEVARHAGHADILREQIDGATGR